MTDAPPAVTRSLEPVSKKDSRSALYPPWAIESLVRQTASAALSSAVRGFHWPLMGPSSWFEDSH